MIGMQKTEVCPEDGLLQLVASSAKVIAAYRLFIPKCEPFRG